MLGRGGDIRRGQLLHHAIERESDTVEVLRLLVEQGTPINASVCEDYPSWALFYFMGLGTALHKAVELGKVDAVRYLIGEGADPSIKDSKGRTAIECAQIFNQREVIEALEKGT